MILAAGRGERMLPLSADTPKPLLDVGGETLIERHLTRLRDSGIRDIVINVSHLAHLIEQRLGSGAALGINIVYSREPQGPLETAGGIARALPLLASDSFLVVNGDVWTDFDFSRLLKQRDNVHLVLVANPPHHPQGDFGLVDGRIVMDAETTWTYAGIGLFQRAFFNSVGSQRAALGPLLKRAASDGSLSGELHCGRWCDVGTPERLRKLREACASGFGASRPAT